MKSLPKIINGRVEYKLEQFLSMFAILIWLNGVASVNTKLPSSSLNIWAQVFISVS